MNKRIKTLLAIPVIIIFVVIAIVMFANDDEFIDDFKHIEDTNGADVYTLQTITDEDIINMNIGNKGVWESKDNLTNITTYSSDKFSGVYEVYNTNFVGTNLKVTVRNLKVNEGNFKLVLVVNDEIVHEFNLNESTQTYMLEEVSGNISLRIAGESADFELEV